MIRKRFAATAAIVLLAASSLPALAATTNAATTVTVSRAWLRMLPGNLPAGGYAVITNDGDRARIITAAASAHWQHVMLHESSHADGGASMRMVDKITIPPHAKVTLAPGGYHLMLMGSDHSVKVGDSTIITFTFADGSSVKAPFKAMPANTIDYP